MEDEPSAPASSSPPAAATTTTATCGGGGPGSARTLPVEMPLAYVNHDIEDIYRRWDAALDLDAGGKAALTAVVTDLLRDVPATEDALNVRLIALARSAGRGSGFKGLPKKSQLLKVYRDMLASGAAQPSRALADRLVTRAAKSQSGVVSVTVLTSPYPPGDDGTPQPFSCKHDCFYCPNQPGQPRSYLRDEPAVMRANQNGFDAVLQFTERAAGLALHGHHIDKVEVLVLGGTWSNYPARYQEDFVRDLFYAANVFGTATRSDGLRERRSLEEEQALNEAAACKVIGVTLETRPDALDEAEVLRMRRLGCTRVQIGVQHTDDGVLRKINRGHDAASSVEAIRLLKDYCFKIDAHLMPNLPGAHPDLDEAMLLEVFESEDYQVDQVKIYPCDTTPYTTILEWYDDGTYVPYSEEDLRRVLVAAKSRVPPWLRLNRVIRDIPGKYIEAGPKENLRETVLRDMREQGLLCKCIRCREVGDMGGRRQGAGNRDGVAARRRAEELLGSDAVLVTRRYRASGGLEYFLSFETEDRMTLYGFCRLRVSERAYCAGAAAPDLAGAGMVRELHVYGQLIGTADADDTSAQHVGLGRQLLAEAEHIAFSEHGLARTVVIAGVGARGYYRKLGYELNQDPTQGLYMRKELRAETLLPRHQPKAQGGGAAAAGAGGSSSSGGGGERGVLSGLVAYAVASPMDLLLDCARFAYAGLLFVVALGCCWTLLTLTSTD